VFERVVCVCGGGVVAYLPLRKFTNTHKDKPQ
jgi:hypothetical protein